MTAPDPASDQGLVLLALDAASWITGWAVFRGEEVAATGVIGLPRSKDGPFPPERLAHLVGELDALSARWQPQEVVVSQPSGLRWQMPALDLVIEGLRDWGRRRQLPLQFYTDQEVRRAISGRERVTASQLAYDTMALLGVVGQPRTTREWEAIAAGYYHLANRG